MKRAFAAFSTLFALVVACATLGFGPPDGRETKRVSAGTWGAMGVAMEVTDSGATIEYDCAHGTIDQPLLLDADGRFDVKGHHFREHGGPIRQGEETKGEPVHYVGQVTGDTLTMTVKPDGSDTPIRSLELIRGKSGRIHKCL
jgi:hypothetical protein